MTRKDPLSACVLASAMIALVLVGVGAHALSGAGGVVLGLCGWMLSTGRRPWVLPRWAGGLLLGVIVVWGALQFVASEGPSVRAFVAFLGWIIVIKCWSPRGPRDLGQIIAVSMFVALGTMLSSTSMLVGVLVAVMLPVFVLSAMLLQIDLARARARAASGRQAGASAAPLGGVARASLATLVLCLAGAAAVFVFVPRTRAFGGLSGLGLSGDRMSGFRDRVDLGRAGFLSDSQGIALLVQVEGGSIPPVAGPEGELYLRGAVLDEYQGMGAWRASDGPEGIPAWSAESQTRVDLTPAGGARASCELTVTERAGASPRAVVFAPWRPLWLRVLGQESPSVHVQPGSGTAVLEGLASPARYRVACTLESGGGGADSRRGRVTFGSVSVREEARRVLEDAGLEPDPGKRPVEKDGAAARALERHLQAWRYSRSLRAPPRGMDPIDWFLTEGREGHCEYFAAALAAMCRGVGIDARVVTGYLTSEFDPSRGTYTVRHANAHAWVEAEVAPGVWRTLDATPAEERARLAGSERGVWLALERWLAGIESAWSSSIVGFGPQVQDQVTGGVAQQLGRRVSDAVDAMAAYLGRRGFVAVGAWMLILAGGLALVAGVVGWVVRAVWRARTRGGQGPGARRGGAWGRTYQRVLRCWKRLGLPKPAWRPAMEHLREIEASSPRAAEASREVLEACYAAFFSGREPDEAALARARASVERLESLAR